MSAARALGPGRWQRGVTRWSTLAMAAVLLAAAAALVVVAVRGSAPPANLQDRVRSVASSLRCPVCQNLSVADSPSRLATQMRTTIGQEIQAGRTPQQIRAEFAAAYGEWILLAPPKHGIDMAVWLAPLVLILGGLALAVVAIRRWTAGASPPSTPSLEETEQLISADDRAMLDRALATVAEDVE